MNNDVNKIETADNIDYSEASNPMKLTNFVQNLSLGDYKQEIPKQKYDNDLTEILEAVRILNNLVPKSLPKYNFDIEKVDGERYKKPDGTLLFVREYDSDVIRDYYVGLNSTMPHMTVNRILEHDKVSGRLRVKIQPIIREGILLNINVIIFDEKINNKYILIQLNKDGIVCSITEFSGKYKSFRTLFRNQYNSKPVRYIEGKDDIKSEFVMVDCLFTKEGNVARIKRYIGKKEINIEYKNNTKSIRVKNKI